MAFNKQHQRVGTLFQTPFKRSLVNEDEYLTQLIYYIHANPQLHGLVNDFRNWNWSSYKRILKDNPSKLKKKEVIAWFTDLTHFQKCHEELYYNISTKNIEIDDFDRFDFLDLTTFKKLSNPPIIKH
jgi:hypothetical protein